MKKAITLREIKGRIYGFATDEKGFYRIMDVTDKYTPKQREFIEKDLVVMCQEAGNLDFEYGETCSVNCPLWHRCWENLEEKVNYGYFKSK